jgi:hypothetical protein
MATRIADIIVPEVLTDMVSAMISPYIDFVKLGIATKDYENVDIREGGHFAEIPFYDQLTGDDEVLTDDTSMTPGKISTRKDIGVVCHRGRAWASRDLAKILSGDDPMKEIAKQVSSYWGKMSKNHLISVLNAAFDPTSGPLKDTHRLQVGVTTGDKVQMAHNHVVNAAALLGDMMEEFDCIVMHSKQYADAINANMVSFPYTYDPKNTNLRGKGQFMGLDIIVTDNLPVDASVADYPLYTSYLMKKGCMYYGMQKEIMTENDRDILALQDVLATSMHFVPHLKLVKWNVTDTNPSNAALATPTNWQKIAEDDKFIGAVALITN